MEVSEAEGIASTVTVVEIVEVSVVQPLESIIPMVITSPSEIALAPIDEYVIELTPLSCCSIAPLR